MKLCLVGGRRGRKYLEETGRVDGWIVYYARGTNTVTAPQEVYDNVVLYQSAEGAQLLTAKYGNCEDPEKDWVKLNIDFKIGDTTSACIIREMQSSGKNRVNILIEFTYKNIAHTVSGWGWENEVSIEYVKAVAETLLAKLEAAPLSDVVTFSP